MDSHSCTHVAERKPWSLADAGSSPGSSLVTALPRFGAPTCTVGRYHRSQHRDTPTGKTKASPRPRRGAGR